MSGETGLGYRGGGEEEVLFGLYSTYDIIFRGINVFLLEMYSE